MKVGFRLVKAPLQRLLTFAIVRGTFAVYHQAEFRHEHHWDE